MFPDLSNLRALLPLRVSLSVVVLAGVLAAAAPMAQAQGVEVRSAAPARLLNPIDDRDLVTLRGSVRKSLTAARDLGPVEDSMPMHLYLVLQRTPAQQADLENLIARQQERTAAEYHKWLTPKQFGARFGAHPDDIAKLTSWLGSHGFEVRSVLNNASMIDFAGTAGQIREAFHTEMHYWNMPNGKFAANALDPQIPAALAPVVAGVMGLDKVPPRMHHTAPRQVARDTETHRYKLVNPTVADKARPGYSDGYGDYLVAPGDLYTIYNVNPIFTGGHLGATANVAVIEESDIEYGTVTAGTGVATGGDVVTFRTLFGVPGTLNMHVYHGYGTTTCTAPGIDPSSNGEDEEASLDAEWINATAPSANLIFMSCDDSTDNGIFTSMAALIDNNLSDVMSMSYGEGESEILQTDPTYALLDGLEAQAATQGQSIFISAGDSGSDVADQNTPGTATSGLNVSVFGSPLVTVAGGTDFSDFYDAGAAGPPVSTYWGATNSANNADALSYVPETAWNNSCASSIIAASVDYTPIDYCGALDFFNDGSVVGGSGGISTHYTVPAWQTGTSGYSNAYHAQPDVSGFASNGAWYHALLFCDSNGEYGGGFDCSSSGALGEAGGTSFVAPYLAGAAGLLVDVTGARQGLLNPTLYALAKAQYTNPATATACYSNGQTLNAGVTTGLPAAACIFNDVTTSNNDMPCQQGTTDCYVDTTAGYGYGMLSTTGAASLTVAYNSQPGFDQVTGLGTLNISNLITKWDTAFTSATALTASLNSITATQSTTLTATVTGGKPANYVDTPPKVTGTVSFKAGTTVLGSCTLASGNCNFTVVGNSLSSGANSITAIFSGSGTYPSSTSSVVTVTVSGGSPVTLSPTSLAFATTTVGTSSGSQTVVMTNSGSAALSIASIAVTGANASSFVFANSCGTSLAAGANCTIHGHFAPTAGGALAAAVTITDNAIGSPQTVALSGTGVEPPVTLSAASLTFGSVNVGAISGSQTVTMTNTGTAALTIGSIAVTGANASSFVFANSCGASLAVGAICTIHGHFAPAMTGALAASITITDSAAGSPQTIKLSGTGLPPLVTLSASSLAFGSTTVGSISASQTVIVTNTGTAALTIGSIAVTGTNASQFVFANTCGTSLAVGASCSIHGHFQPTSAGAKTAAVTITDSALSSPQSIALSGTGVAQTTPVTLSATSLAFGTTKVGTLSVSQSVTMTNAGTTTLTITSIAVTGANANQFVFANTCGTSLAIGASCTIHGHFQPTATGAMAAAITITDNAAGSPQSITLSGTGD